VYKRQDQRSHPFTADRSERIVRHTGASDQAIVQLIWPSRDGEDPVSEQEFALLQRVVQLAVTDSLRERLGKAYSPGVSSETSRVWRDYGTFGIAALVAVSEVEQSQSAINATVAALRDAPISADMLLRARAPMLDGIDNALKTNRGWLALVDRAQTEPDRIERYLGAKARLSAITPARIQELVRRYLTAEGAVPVVVLPELSGTQAP
jgi:zinc protease